MYFQSFLFALSHNFCFHAVLKVEKQKVNLEAKVIMLVYSKKGKNASPTAHKTCAICRKSAVGDNTVLKWFEEIKSGNFHLRR